MAIRMPVSRRRDEIDLLAAQLNRMFDQLEQMMEAIRQVSSDMAHDMRTPLTRLQQHLDALRAADDSDRAILADAALAESRNMQNIFGALLRIAQIEGRAAQAGFSDVDLSAMMLEVADIYEPVFADSSRSLQSEVTPSVHVQGDSALLRQMFANLLENIITHTPAGTNACIRLQQTEATGWHAVIVDDGPGVPAEHREKLFRRFYRVDASRTSSGTGLGLALVKAIADAHSFSLEIVPEICGFAIRLGGPPKDGEGPGSDR